MSPSFLFVRLLDQLPAGVAGALMPMLRAKEIGMGVAAIITLLGVRLCWDASNARMVIEERAKDGKLTEEQARRKIGRLVWFGPTVTFVGVALLGLVPMR